MFQPALSREDNLVRVLQPSHLLKVIHWNDATQIRALSLSMSVDNDSGEKNPAYRSSEEIKIEKGIHLTSALPVDIQGGEALYPALSVIKTTSDSSSMDFGPFEIPSYDHTTGYDEETESMPMNIVSHSGIDDDRGKMSLDFSSVPSLINEPSEVENQDLVIAGERYQSIDDNTPESIETEESFETSTTYSNSSIMSENQNPAVTEQELEVNEKVSPPRKHPLVSRLTKCIYDEDVKYSIKTFNKIMEINKTNAKNKQPSIDIAPGLTKALLSLVQPGNPFELYRIIQYYMSLPTSHEKSLGGSINLYKRYIRMACDSLRHIDARVHDKKDVKRLTINLMALVSKLDKSGKEACAPVLLSSICEQPFIKIGEDFAGQIYNYIMDQELSVPDGYWIHLLTFSKYSRQDIPYDEILSRAVSLGLRPDPILALNVLEHLFPFSNTDSVTNALKALLTLQKQVATDIKAAKEAAINDETVKIDDVVAKQYFVDMYLLETIGAAAASQGQSEICLMIWDMLDVLEYKASVGIYENTVVAFAMNVFTYREAFTVMYEMESRGYHPSRALIRSFSVHVR